MVERRTLSGGSLTGDWQLGRVSTCQRSNARPDGALRGGWSMDDDDIDRLLAEFGLELPEVEDEPDSDALPPRGGWEDLE